jgi:predicted ATPase
MLELALRQEFKGERLRGTTIDFSADRPTSALQRSAAEFLSITYPSVDLLRVIEATQPDKARPVVLLGGRGQGKSHLMAALWHAIKDPAEATKWLADWAARLNRPELKSLRFRTDFCVIAESLHQQRFKFLWDILFDRHPQGQLVKGKWLGKGDARTNVPSIDLLLEMFQAQPTALLLDEFQTWFDGLSDSPKEKPQTWAFNFIRTSRSRPTITPAPSRTLRMARRSSKSASATVGMCAGLPRPTARRWS